MNKLLAVFILITVQAIGNIEAQKMCYDCHASYGRNEAKSCFKQNPDVEPTNCSQNCTAKIQLVDGKIGITKSCGSEENDDCIIRLRSGDLATYDKNFDEIDYTRLREHGSWVDETKCNYKCKTKNCEPVKTITSIPCLECPISRGKCDVSCGKCNCNDGYFGVACQIGYTLPTPARKCVQCNSETDSDCKEKRTATKCNENYKLCSTTQTWQINSDGKMTKNIITRGCVDAYKSEDHCEIVSYTPASYVQTCFSTCMSDGCNTDLPDGFPGEKKRMRCVQCITTDDGCKDKTKDDESLCPSRLDSYCFTKVAYVVGRIDELDPGNEPSYKLLSLERGCSSTPMKKQCISSQVSTLSVDRIECQESCDADGCNTGWPNRPRCYKRRPIHCGKPLDCDGPHQPYCILSKTGILVSNDDDLGDGKEVCLDYPKERIDRWYCSFFDLGNSCRKYTKRTRTYEDCLKTCTEDGCNGDAARYLSFMAVIASVVANVLYTTG